MNPKEYIVSGILELYVAGALSEQENEEVYAMMQQHPEVLQEVLKIEAAVLSVTAATSSKDTTHIYENVKAHIQEDTAPIVQKVEEHPPTKVVPIKKSGSIFLYIGWAAALILAGSLAFTLVKNNDLKSEIEVVTSEREALKDEVYETNNDLAAANELLDVLRTKDIISVPLGGQKVSPESYARVYWDQKTNKIYLDLKGLPEPPKGKVYQVWSLTLDPLTPTSLGVIEKFNDDQDKVFNLENTNESEAFGITLEPEGGSESPTLEQLYTLGVVASNP